MKRHFYNKKEYQIDYENKTIILNQEFHEKLKNKKLWNKFGFKKIGGSSIADVLETDNFKSPFVAFCRMAWIGLPILDRKYVDAGVAIEPKVIEAIEKKMKISIETFPAEKYNYDYFKNTSKIFGGLPDGFIKEKKIVLEIKTTGEKNLQNWDKFGVPVAYIKQAQLYAFLMNVEKFSIVATFLKEKDYVDPHNYPIKNRIIKNWSYKVNLEQVKDDLSFVEKWYKNHIESGISPTYNENKDHDLLLWLECENPMQWEKLKNKWIEEGKIK